MINTRYLKAIWKLKNKTGGCNIYAATTNQMILLISLIIFIAWLLLGYFLLKKPPAEFLSRRKRILLYAATLVTAGLFVHDYLFDKGSTPMIYEQVFCEIILSGTIYVGLIFVLGYAFDAWINKRA